MFGLANQGQTDAKNVFASGAGYIPVRDMSAISTALNGQCAGAFSAIDAFGSINTFAGDGTKLYKLSAGTFSDVSKSGGYSVGTVERWKFVQFGQRVIATEITDPVQYYDMGSSTLFADLTGSPPKARHIARIRDFVVLANTANSPSEVYWSGFNDSTNWTKGTAQCDSQTLQDGGWIQGIVGGDVGYVFQDNIITRMTYVGPPLYFQFDVLETNRGVAAPGSLVKVGASVFFLDHDGFYQKDGDNQSVSIGNQMVDQWFAAHLQPNTLEEVTSGFDPQNKLVFWSFVSTDATDVTKPDTILAYNWYNKQWSYAKLAHELIYPALSEAWTLEGIGLVYSTIESVPISFDSRAWTGGAAYMGIFNSSHQLCSLAGSNLAATMTTADVEPSKGRRSIITNLRPLCDTSAATITCQSRERFADSEALTSSAAMQSNGDVPLLSSGRFHRLQIDIPAGTTWTFANGLDIDAEDDGEL
jgi:hypothetical protein